VLVHPGHPIGTPNAEKQYLLKKQGSNLTEKMGTTKQKGWWQSAKSRGKKTGNEKKNTPLEERVELPSLCRSTAKLILVRHSARVAQREREGERADQSI
jgi:hypothetical protein